MTLPDVWALAAILTKFALYLGVLVSSGTALTSLVFRLKSYRGVSTSFAILGLCASILSFSLLGANLAGDASGLLDGELLGLLWGTAAGTTLSFQLVGVIILIFGLLLGQPGRWISAFGVSSLYRLSVILGILPDMTTYC